MNRIALETAGLARRTFLTTSVAIGFAAAIEPVWAQIVHTDSEGLVAGEVKVPVEGGAIPAYRAYPAQGSGAFPVILVVHEIFGVHEHIQDICRRLAKLGYFAISADLYSRQGDVAKLASPADIMAVVKTVPDAQAMRDLDAAVAYAAGTGKANTARLGITGFCWGGRIVWDYAAHNPKLKAGVAWYGPLASTYDPNGRTAIALAKDGAIKPPVLGLYAGKDGGITREDVEEMRAALKGSGSEIVVYPEAQHGFHADYRPSYDPAAARDGWQRLQGWFKAHGVA